MATPTTYTYSISTAFPNHKVSTDRLTLEIQTSTIITALDSITTVGDNCNILFKDVLSGGDQTTLNAIVAAHTGAALPGGSQAVQQFSLAVGQQNQPLSYGRAVGYTATSATTNKAVRATTYTPQGTNAQRSINSTSANDTAAGTGARTVIINYLTAAFVLKSETVTLNGTTAVNTVNTDIAYIESLVVASVGSGSVNAGAIQLWTTTGGTGSIWASAAAGDQGTAYAHHYVPTGVTCYILNLNAGATVVSGVTNLVHQTQVANSPAIQIGAAIVHPAAGQWDHDFPIWLTLTGPELIWVNEKPTAATASVAWSGFEYVQF